MTTTITSQLNSETGSVHNAPGRPSTRTASDTVAVVSALRDIVDHIASMTVETIERSNGDQFVVDLPLRALEQMVDWAYRTRAYREQSNRRTYEIIENQLNRSGGVVDEFVNRATAELAESLRNLDVLHDIYDEGKTAWELLSGEEYRTPDEKRADYQQRTAIADAAKKQTLDVLTGLRTRMGK